MKRRRDLNIITWNTNIPTIRKKTIIRGIDARIAEPKGSDQYAMAIISNNPRVFPAHFIEFAGQNEETTNCVMSNTADSNEPKRNGGMDCVISSNNGNRNDCVISRRRSTLLWRVWVWLSLETDLVVP
jgi:hypothetical protein